jgi:hypothetical protein
MKKGGCHRRNLVHSLQSTVVAAPCNTTGMILSSLLLTTMSKVDHRALTMLMPLGCISLWAVCAFAIVACSLAMWQ